MEIAGSGSTLKCHGSATLLITKRMKSKLMASFVEPEPQEQKLFAVA